MKLTETAVRNARRADGLGSSSTATVSTVRLTDRSSGVALQVLHRRPGEASAFRPLSGDQPQGGESGVSKLGARSRWATIRSDP